MSLLGKFLEVELPGQRYFNFEKKKKRQIGKLSYQTTHLISMILTVGKCGCLFTLSKTEICVAMF